MLLEAASVSAGYGHRRVVDQVSLSVRPGELVAVLGPNGAGKSTLVRALLGLSPLRGGVVRVLGKDLAAYPRAELARQVAWVPQGVDEAAGFTALELVLMGRAPHLGLWGLCSDSDVALARSVLRELGVEHLAARSVDELSGGERRMLGLARALVQEPSLLVLDEPTAFLDLRHQVEVLGRVKERLARGLGALAVLHDVNLAAAFADRVLLLREGAVLAQGPTGEVLDAGHLERLFGVPMRRAHVDGQSLYAPRLGP